MHGMFDSVFVAPSARLVLNRRFTPSCLSYCFTLFQDVRDTSGITEIACGMSSGHVRNVILGGLLKGFQVSLQVVVVDTRTGIIRLRWAAHTTKVHVVGFILSNLQDSMPMIIIGEVAFFDARPHVWWRQVRAHCQVRHTARHNLESLENSLSGMSAARRRSMVHNW